MPEFTSRLRRAGLSIGGGGRGAQDDGPGPPSRLLALAIDGVTPLPGVPEPEENEED
jgi:hypothetical protein